MELQFWMNLQSHYDLEVARDAMAGKLDREVEVLGRLKCQHLNAAIFHLKAASRLVFQVKCCHRIGADRAAYLARETRRPLLVETARGAILCAGYS